MGIFSQIMHFVFRIELSLCSDLDLGVFVTCAGILIACYDAFVRWFDATWLLSSMIVATSLFKYFSFDGEGGVSILISSSWRHSEYDLLILRRRQPLGLWMNTRTSNHFDSAKVLRTWSLRVMSWLKEVEPRDRSMLVLSRRVSCVGRR